jgi:hypothetical protein
MLEETVLYYGHYTDQSIQLIPHLAFDMPAAYFSVMAVLYMISFVALAVSVAESYRRSFIETEGGLQNVFASKIFCAWDFGIATKEAAALKSLAIYNELRELLSEAIKNDPRRSCLHKFYTSIIQIVVNLLVLVILGAVGWLTWMLLTRFSLDNSDNILITPVVVNIIIMIIPVIFNYIAKYEDYNNPKTAIYITLFRTFLLGSVIVGVILTFWLKESGNIVRPFTLLQFSGFTFFFSELLGKSHRFRNLPSDIVRFYFFGDFHSTFRHRIPHNPKIYRSRPQKRV